MDEDQDAAYTISDLLTSAMFRAHEVEKRDWFYGWERRGYRWLIRFKERRPDGVMCAWSSSFLDLNRDAILADHGKLNFNLRAARIAAESRKV